MTETARPGAPAGRGTLAGVRVLVVDDTPDMRHLLRAAVESAGADVVGEAADGETGVRLAGSLRPDLVLLDVSMPGMSGLTALPLLLTAVPGCRVVVMSGFEAVDAAEEALRLGASAYLEKGARLAELTARLAEVLARPGP